jgi:hypothetical protein
MPEDKELLMRMNAKRISDLLQVMETCWDLIGDWKDSQSWLQATGEPWGVYEDFARARQEVEYRLDVVAS